MTEFTGRIPGGKKMVYRTYSEGEELYLCAGICPQRGPLWLQLDDVDWEDINCPRCLATIDMAGTLEV